ncbi:MAG TPA: CotH kinase family protein, partial [Bacillota bacterium]|nr:CotH kinase family protein [Bacillota bacterium]
MTHLHRFLLLFCAAAMLLMLIASCSPQNGVSTAPAASSEADPGQASLSEESTAQTEFIAAGLEELEALLTTLPQNGSAVVTVTGDVTVNADLTVGFPLTLIFGGTVEYGGSTVYVKTDSEAPITVITRSGAQEGAICIEAPFASLVWEGEQIPDELYTAMYMNVKEYNGTPMSKYGYGGTGSARLELLDACGLEWTVDGSTVSAVYPYSFNEKELLSAVPETTSSGETAFSGEKEDGTVDLSDGCTLCVTDGDGASFTYVIMAVRKIYSIPQVNIYTDDGCKITERYEYVGATVSITGVGEYESLAAAAAQIRGRGHSTWKFEKKPYRIKFDEKTKVLGMKKSRDWVLLANYSDKSLIRNTVALELAAQFSFDFTPQQIPVDLFVNGEYAGVYSLGQRIEVTDGRVELAEGTTPETTGYMFEIGGADTSSEVQGIDYFTAGYIKFARIIYPEDEDRTAQMNKWLISYMKKADEAVTALDGYEEYIDVDSFVDWFIFTELTYNLDACFRRSCFMTLDAGGKLKMGPVWDFDLALGNFSKDNFSYNDWASVGAEDEYVKVTWMNFLTKDESFMTRVSERWNALKDTLYDCAMESIERNSALVGASQEENFTVWDIWNERAGY